MTAVVISHFCGCRTGYSRCGTVVEDIAMVGMVDRVRVAVMVTMLRFIEDKSSAILTYFSQLYFQGARTIFIV